MIVPDAAAFRAAGYTSAAADFPISDAAVAWLARLTGIPVDKVPPAWRFAPNAYMQRYAEQKGADECTEAHPK